MEKQFQTPACLKISGCRQQMCLTLMKKEEQKEVVKKEEEEGDCPSPSRAGGIALGGGAAWRGASAGGCSCGERCRFFSSHPSQEIPAP